MNHGNLRGILHQGVDAWLNSLAEEPDEEDHFRLLDDLDNRLTREEAVRWLTVALEAVVENYAEYVDYNSTTTQSDRGDMLYTLLGLPAAAGELRPRGLEPSARGPGPRGPGPQRARRGGRRLAGGGGRADVEHRRGPPQDDSRG